MTPAEGEVLVRYHGRHDGPRPLIGFAVVVVEVGGTDENPVYTATLEPVVIDQDGRATVMEYGASVEWLS